MRRRVTATLVAPLLVMGLAGCDIDRTQEGELPDVDVEGGQLPEYDVDAADVDVGTDTQTVIVPDVDVTPPDTNVTPPDTARSP